MYIADHDYFYLNQQLSQGTNQQISALGNQKADVGFDDYDIFWIANGSLVSEKYSSPNSPFPYGRLSTISTNTTALFYHQLNESILLEEVVEIEAGSNGWGSPTYIHVPTS